MLRMKKSWVRRLGLRKYAHADVTEHCAIPDYSKVYVKGERGERASGEAAVEVELCEVERDIEVLG